MELDEKIQKFKGAEQLQLSVFIENINAFVSLPRESFSDLFKPKGKATRAVSQKIDLFRKELAEATKPILGVQPAAVLSKRATFAELVADIYYLTYAYVNKSPSPEVVAMFDGDKSYQEILAEAKAILLSESGTAFHKLIEVVMKLARDNEALRKDAAQSRESIKSIELKLLDANTTIEELKVRGQKLGTFKYTNMRDAPTVASSQKKRMKAEDSPEIDLTADTQLSEIIEPPRVNRPPPSSTSHKEDSDQQTASVQEQPFRVQLPNGRSVAESVAFATPAFANGNSRRSGGANPTNKNQQSGRPNNNRSSKNNNNNKSTEAKASNNNSTAARRVKCVIGTQSSSAQASSGSEKGLCAAVRRFHFFVGRMHASVNVNDLKDHIKSVIGCDVLEIEELISTQNFYKNFKVVVEDLHGPKMLEPANWPRNVRVGRFFLPKADRKVRQPVMPEFRSDEASSTAQPALISTQQLSVIGTPKSTNKALCTSNNDNPSMEDENSMNA
jgi:hypothetical protein